VTYALENEQKRSAIVNHYVVGMALVERTVAGYRIMEVIKMEEQVEDLTTIKHLQHLCHHYHLEQPIATHETCKQHLRFVDLIYLE
jgi:hypothetical protein